MLVFFSLKYAQLGCCCGNRMWQMNTNRSADPSAPQIMLKQRIIMKWKNRNIASTTNRNFSIWPQIGFIGDEHPDEVLAAILDCDSMQVQHENNNFEYDCNKTLKNQKRNIDIERSTIAKKTIKITDNRR